MAKTKIVWNDVDGYVELDACDALGYKTKGNKLIGKTESHEAFEAFRVAIDNVPKDENEEPNFDGYFLTESGACYALYIDYPTK